LGEQVVLQVRDSGRGMASEQLLHVFEPFNRLGLERKGIEGTGIGLAIVKANVERMGGTVHVQSTVGVGSVFEVRLPSAASAPAPPPPVETVRNPDVAPTEAARTGRLLYIEDNPVNALIVRELIAQRGNLTLDEADDGASGIESARECHPDLILVDMQLPDFDGLEVLRRLRADPSTAAIPCIALSANAMPEDIQLALGAGFADYWTKPLDFRVFLGALDTLFGKRG
jgi:CheY-like chemotaxis protein